MTDVPTYTGLLLGERYRLDDPLARGALCQVYRGTDEMLHRPVAIKAVPPEHTEMYGNALRITAALTHPTIVYVLDAIEHDGWYFLVQEMVRGNALAAHARDGLSVERALDLALHLARCLAHAHEHGVTHGDITPAAVLLERNGGVRLNNFALPPDTEYFAGLPMAAELLARALDIPVAPRGTAEEPPATAADVRALGFLLWQVLSAPADGERRDFRADVPVSVRQLAARLLIAEHPSVLNTFDESVPEVEALLRDLGAMGDQEQPTPAALRALRRTKSVDPATAWAAADTVVGMPPTSPPWSGGATPAHAAASAYDTAPTRPAVTVPPGRVPISSQPVRSAGPSGPLRSPPLARGSVSGPLNSYIPPSWPAAYRPATPLPWSDDPAIARWASEGTSWPYSQNAAGNLRLPARRRGAGVLPIVLIGLALFIMCFLIGYLAPLVIR